MQELGELVPTGITGLVSSVVGGGLVYWALVARLTERFASKKDVGDVAEAVQEAKAKTEEHTKQVARLETICENQAETNLRLADGHGEITKTLVALQVSQAKTEVSQAKTEQAVTTLVSNLGGEG